MRILVVVLGLPLLLAVSACSEVIYDMAQSHNESDCRKLPPHQYDACLKQTRQSYGDYQEEREALLDEG